MHHKLLLGKQYCEGTRQEAAGVQQRRHAYEGHLLSMTMHVMCRWAAHPYSVAERLSLGAEIGATANTM